MSTITPVVLWAQRSSETEPEKNVLYVTIKVQDATDIKLDLKAESLEFSSGTSDNASKYHFKIDFFDEVDPENSKQYTESGSHVFLVIRKKNHKQEYWPRITKEKVKLHWIKTDFDKWVDEDEQDEQPEDKDDMANMMGGAGMGGAGMPGMGGMGDMDFSKLMQGMGGAGGPGGDFDISKLASQLGQAGANLDGINEDGDNEGEESEEKVEEVK